MVVTLRESICFSNLVAFPQALQRIFSIINHMTFSIILRECERQMLNAKH